MKFQDSKLAHKYLDGLKGIEIGGSAHNPFNLDGCINVDKYASMDTIYKNAEFAYCGEKLKVDVVANGDNLPFKDNQYDYVISSHVIEHFFDPIKALTEWLRVIKKGGYIFIICPTQFALPGENRPCTTVNELIDRNTGKLFPDKSDDHFSVWSLPEFLELCEYMKLNVVEALATDDKVGNGFCVIIQK